MDSKILITGISGFVGTHLAQYLLSCKNYEVSGTYLTEKGLTSISHIQDDLSLFSVDLNDQEHVTDVIETVKPDYIFHLAALAAPGDSFAAPTETILNNVASQINLLEAVKNAGLLSTRILVVSSADIYGIVKKEDIPIDEQTPFNPTNPYAVSKLTQDFLGLQYYLAHKLSIIRVRPFNHIGPGQSPHFAVPTFAKKIAQIEKGQLPPVLRVGNLETKRDFTDVRDMVRAYELIMQKGDDGEVYNIGSGEAEKMAAIVEKLLFYARVPITVEVDDSLLRPTDTPELVCDPTKIHKVTGWKPQIPLDQTLKEVLEYWRKIV